MQYPKNTTNPINAINPINAKCSGAIYRKLKNICSGVIYHAIKNIWTTRFIVKMIFVA